MQLYRRVNDFKFRIVSHLTLFFGIICIYARIHKKGGNITTISHHAGRTGFVFQPCYRLDIGTLYIYSVFVLHVLLIVFKLVGTSGDSVIG
jgi:hypothetical protein